MGSTGENVAPSFVKKPQLRQEDDGNRLIFECKLSGSPKPDVVWFNEDVKIVDDERTSIKVVEDGKNQFAVILELNDVVETDAGLYKVKAKNKYGEVSASINLNFSPVDAPPQPQVDGTAPTFSKKPTIIQKDDGNTLVFHCAIVADPPPMITWYHNGVRVQDTPKYQVVTKEENQYTFDSSLIMRNVTVEDAGKYKVTARNDLGESNATISLNFDSDEATIPTGGVKPTFTERPVIRQSDEGTKIIFQCRLAGEPKPNLTWYHGEKVVTESARVKMTMKLDKKMYYLCCLEISNVEAGDAGQYKAVAKNGSGESQATINLTFEESGAAGKPKIPDGVAPRFPNKPTIRQEGDNLVMECQLEAHPMPEITWYRADKRVEENSRIRYECKNVGKHKMLLTLTITNPSMADGGLYRCNAFNPFGDTNANIDLNFETGDGDAAPQGQAPKSPALKKKSSVTEPPKAPADPNAGFPPTFTEKPRIVPNETGTLVTMKFKVRSKPKAEMQWYKGTQKIKEGPKFAVKYNELANDEYEIMLEISKPSSDDGGDYKCMMKNEFGQLQAKLNLNIEAEPAPTAAPAGQAPTFVEKPKIVTKEEGKLIMMIVRYRAEFKSECVWSFKEQTISETRIMKMVHEKNADFWESRVELTDPAPENAGMYKCVVKNKFGEINANLSLNIEIAPVIRDRPIIRKVEKKKSVVLQCAVQGSQDIEVQWFKEGTAINLDNQERFTIEKKKSEQREGETIVQLEIQDTDVSDQGIYQLVAKSETGETQSQTVTLQEDQVKMEAAEAAPEADTASASLATEESAVKKKKKKVVKKKKKKEEEVSIPKPELSSYLKNFIKKEGESIEMKCRLEEDYEEGQVTMTWFFNGEKIESSDRCMITFDGTYATLFIAACTMDDMGEFKVHFENKSGSDESTGKVTVKPKPQEAKPQDDTKKKEEKKVEPKPEPKPFKMPKKVEKKPEPEPEPEPPKPAFKVAKKKSTLPPKEEPKEEGFGVPKLKKTERVQRTWDEPKMESVALAHHEFEKAPQEPEAEGKSTVKLGKAIECDLDEKEEKEPKKKKKKAKKSEEDEEEEEENFQDPKKVKKSVSFKLEPEIETFESLNDNRTPKSVRKTVKKIVHSGRKTPEPVEADSTDSPSKGPEAVEHDTTALEQLKISEEDVGQREVKSGSSIRSWVAKRDAMKKNHDNRGSPSMTRQNEQKQKATKTIQRKLRQMSADEEEVVITENTYFIIDESKSTGSSKFVVRRRTLLHRLDQSSAEKPTEWTEVFEETFTIPLHKFNLSLILSQTKIENVEETIIINRTVRRKKAIGLSFEHEEIELTSESEQDLPMIDFSEISHIQITETRSQIVQRLKERQRAGGVSLEQAEESEAVPDLEKIKAPPRRQKKEVERALVQEGVGQNLSLVEGFTNIHEPMNAIFSQSSSLKDTHKQKEEAVSNVAARPLLPRFFANAQRDKKEVGKKVQEKGEKQTEEELTLLIKEDEDLPQKPIESKSGSKISRRATLKARTLGHIEGHERAQSFENKTENRHEGLTSRKTSAATLQKAEFATTQEGFQPRHDDAFDIFERVEHIQTEPRKESETALVVKTSTANTEQAHHVPLTKGFLPDFRKADDTKKITDKLENASVGRVKSVQMKQITQEAKMVGASEIDLETTIPLLNKVDTVEDSTKSEVRSKSTEKALLYGTALGLSIVGLEVDEIAEQLKEEGVNAELRKPTHSGRGTAMIVVRNFGCGGPATERATSITPSVPAEELPAVEKVRSKSQERVNLHGQSVGYFSEKETAGDFKNNFEVKYEKAAERKAENKSDSIPENVSLRSGHMHGATETTVPIIEQIDSLETPTKSKVHCQSTERATQEDKTIGFDAEEEVPEEFSDKFTAKSKTLVATEETNKSVERAIHHGTSVGQNELVESSARLPSDFHTSEFCQIKDSPRVAGKQATRGVQTVGVSQALLEETSPFRSTHEATEIPKKTVERRKSTEIASLHSNTVGFREIEENPEQLPNKVKVKTEKASETKIKAKSSLTERAHNIGTNSGFQQPLDEALFDEKDQRKFEHAALKGAQCFDKEKIVLEAKCLGSSPALTEKTGSYTDSLDEAHTPKVSQVKSNYIENALLSGKEVGFVAEEEKPEHFKDKFEVKTEAPIKSTVRSKSAERASLQSNIVGFQTKEEIPGQYMDKCPVLAERAVVKNSKVKLKERANQMPQVEGFHQAEDEVFSVPNIPNRTDRAELSRATSDVIERAIQEAKCQGGANKDTAGAFIENADKAKQVVTTKVKSKTTKRAVLQGNTLGLDVEEDISENFEDIKPNADKANKTKSRSKSTERAAMQSGLHGFDNTLEESGTFSQKFTPNSKKANKSAEPATKIVSSVQTAHGLEDEQRFESATTLVSETNKDVQANETKELLEIIIFGTTANQPIVQEAEFSPNKDVAEYKALTVEQHLQEEATSNLPSQTPPEEKSNRSKENQSKSLAISMSLEIGSEAENDVSNQVQKTATEKPLLKARTLAPTSMSLLVSLTLADDSSVEMTPPVDASDAAMRTKAPLQSREIVQKSAHLRGFSPSRQVTSNLEVTDLVDRRQRAALKKSRQLEASPVRKSVVLGESLSMSETKDLANKSVDSAKLKPSTHKDVVKKQGLRITKSVGEEYCDFTIGFNAGNYEMADMVLPKSVAMKRPLRKSLSEGFEPRIAVAHNIEDEDNLKQYSNEATHDGSTLGRAISVTSNQGFDALMLEPDIFEPDPLCLKDSSVRSQEHHLKQEIKSTPKNMGYVMHLEELEQNIPQENLEFSRAKSTFREPPENAQTKAVIQGFIPMDEALQDMDHTEFPSKKSNFYLVKTQSRLPSNQSHVLGFGPAPEETDALENFSPTSYGHSIETREAQRLDKGTVGSTLQGFDASTELVGKYDSNFKPKTVEAKEEIFKSSATAKSSFVSIEAGEEPGEEGLGTYSATKPAQDQAKKLASRSKSTERAATLLQVVGFQPEGLSVEELGTVKFPEDMASSSVISSKADKLAAGVVKMCGYEVEENIADTFPQATLKLETAESKKTAGVVKERVVREVKSLGTSSSEFEAATPMSQVQQGGKTTSSKVRSESTERAQLIGRPIGFCADEEFPEKFEGKFDVKANQAVESKAQQSRLETAKSMARNEGLSLEIEETDEFQDQGAKQQKVSSLISKTKATQKATKQSQLFGSSDIGNTAKVLVLEKAKQEKPAITSVKNTHSERATFQEKNEGFEAEEESAEHFSDKFQVKTELAKEGKARALVTNAAHKKPRDEGININFETSESMFKQDTRPENAKRSTIRNISTERASSLARKVGFKVEEEETEKLPGSKIILDQANITKVRSESSERPTIHSRSVGIRAEQEHAEDFLKNFTKKGEHAKTNIVEVSTTRVTKGGAQFGFNPEEHGVEELCKDEPEKENLTPQNVIPLQTHQALRSSNSVGLSTETESTSSVEQLKITGQEANMRTTKNVKVKAQYMSVESGSDTVRDTTDDLPTDNIKPEALESRTETSLTRLQASRLSRRQGFNPQEQSSEFIFDIAIPQETAISKNTRSESNDRAHITLQGLGFEPLELSAESLKDQKPIYGTALPDKQKHTKAIAEKRSISSGRLTQGLQAEELGTHAEKTNQVKERVERKQSSERAIVCSQTLGYVLDTEETSAFTDSGNKVENEKATQNIQSLKGRATSKPRVQGFEPLLEDAEDVSTEGLLVGIAQTCEGNVHRESRSRAVKREKYTGVGLPVEKAEALHSDILLQEDIKESLTTDQLCLANSTVVQSDILPHAAHSALDKTDADASIDLKRAAEEMASSAEKRKKLTKAKVVKSEDIINLVEKGEDDNKRKKLTKEKVVRSEDSVNLLEKDQFDKQNIQKVYEVLEKDDLDERKPKKDLDIKTKPVAKKPSKSKPELKTDGDGTFAIKLKKSEVVKRQVEAPKLEEVRLKHHEFELEPQKPSEEAKTGVKMTKQLDIKTGQKETKLVKKVKKVRKVKKDEKSDTSIDSDLDLQQPMDTPNGSKKLSNPKIPTEEGGLELQCKTDSEVESIETEEIATTTLPKLSTTTKPKTRSDANVKHASSKLSSDGQTAENDFPLNSEPINIDYATVSKEENIGNLAANSETQVGNAPRTELLAKTLKPKQHKEKKEAEIRIEEDGTFIKPKLKAAETIKRHIPEATLVEVDLKHHEFEPEPLEPTKELLSHIILGKALSIQSNTDDKEEKKKKTIIKKKKIKPTAERVEDPLNVDLMPSEEQRPVENSETVKPEVVKQESVKPETKAVVADEEKPKKHIAPVETPAEKPKALKKVPEKPVKKPTKKEAEEEGTFIKPALRKSAPVKREIKDAKLETVSLKSHAFEKMPLDVPCEMMSNVKLGKPLPSLKEKEKDQKENKVIKKKKKKTSPEKLEEDDLKENNEPIFEDSPNVLPTQKVKAPMKANNVNEEDIESPIEDVEEELPNDPTVVKENATISNEKGQKKAKKATTQIGFKPMMAEEEVDVEVVVRKERDPIAVPGAAIVKKHSDIDKVELPAFLNFPTEQGEIVDLDEAAEKSPRILPIESAARTEDITELNTAFSKETKTMKKVVKNTTRKSETAIPIIRTNSDTKEEEIVDKFGEITIEEARDDEIIFDKTKPMSIPIAVIEIPDDQPQSRAKTPEILEITELSEPSSPKEKIAEIRPTLAEASSTEASSVEEVNEEESKKVKGESSDDDMETPTPIVDEVEDKPTPPLKTYTPTETTPEVEVKA